MTDANDTTRRHAVQLAAGVAAVATLGKAASAETRNVVGVWRLVAAKAVDQNGKPVEPPYGPRGIGIVSLSADGRMTNVLVDRKSTRLNSSHRT